MTTKSTLTEIQYYYTNKNKHSIITQDTTNHYLLIPTLTNNLIILEENKTTKQYTLYTTIENDNIITLENNNNHQTELITTLTTNINYLLKTTGNPIPTLTNINQETLLLIQSFTETTI